MNAKQAEFIFDSAERGQVNANVHAHANIICTW